MSGERTMSEPDFFDEARPVAAKLREGRGVSAADVRSVIKLMASAYQRGLAAGRAEARAQAFNESADYIQGYGQAVRRAGYESDANTLVSVMTSIREMAQREQPTPAPANGANEPPAGLSEERIARMVRDAEDLSRTNWESAPSGPVHRTMEDVRALAAEVRRLRDAAEGWDESATMAIASRDEARAEADLLRKDIDAMYNVLNREHDRAEAEIESLRDRWGEDIAALCEARAEVASLTAALAEVARERDEARKELQQEQCMHYWVRKDESGPRVCLNCDKVKR